MLNIENTIRKIMIDEKITVTELAKRIGISTSNLSNKLRRNNICPNDLEKIAESISYELKIEYKKKES